MTNTRAAAMTEPRWALPLAALLGLSAGGYAIMLAGVTALQAQSEAALWIDRLPTERAISDIGAQHDALEARADRAGASYGTAASAYDRIGRTLADVEGQLAALADAVGTIQGDARGLPSRVALPRVTAVAAPAPRPTVHATTAASGG